MRRFPHFLINYNRIPTKNDIVVSKRKIYNKMGMISIHKSIIRIY